MPYPGNHGILTWSGPAYGTLEEWSTSLRIAPSIPPDLAQLAAAKTAFTSLATATGVGMSGAVRLDTVKWAPQDADGRYGGGDAIELVSAAEAIGTQATMPAQISTVVSLRTGRSRGIGSNGRMYLPAMPEASPNTGKMTVQAQSQVQQAAAAFIGAINAIGIGDVVVASRGRTQNGVVVSPGLFEPVTGVRVGRVYDTQRRRRAGLSEDYTDPTPVPS